MVQKANNWNITKEKGLELIHGTIIDTLNETKNNQLPLYELVTQINMRTNMNHIHNKKKFNLLTKYIKSQYGGVIKFIDNYSIYGISYKQNKAIIHLLIDDYIN